MRGLVAALSYREVVQDHELRLVDLGAPVRIEALLAVGELGGEAARDAVVACLSDPIPNVRLTAVRTLRALRHPDVAEPLVRGAVGWRAPPYGQARAEALGILAEGADPDIAHTVVEAIATQERYEQLDEITHAAFTWLVCLPLGANEAVHLLIDRLRAGANRDRIETMLAWTGEQAIDTLIGCLSHPAHRESLARALGKLKSGRAVPGLVDCLNDEAPGVRRAATGALAEIRDPRAIEALVRATSDEDFEARRNAQAALDRLGAISIVAGLSALLSPPPAGSVERLDDEGRAVEALPAPVRKENGHWVPAGASDKPAL